MSGSVGGPLRGVLHQYKPSLTAFEFSDSETPAANVLLFIGGLGNGLRDVPYVPALASALSAATNSQWSVVQALISSSHRAWGLGSLERDAKELSWLVQYLRSDVGGNRKKIVLMGHSTGCQDTIRYLTSLLPESPGIDSISLDGAILQAPVSDAEGLPIGADAKALEDTLSLSKQLVDQGKGDVLLPHEALKFTGGVPITAYRFNSLFSKRGDDDYFSSYLDEKDFERSFARVSTPLLVLYGEKDQFVPDYVNRQQLVDSWRKSTNPKFWSPLSKVLKGATHDVGPQSDEGAQDDLIETVLNFIQTV